MQSAQTTIVRVNPEYASLILERHAPNRPITKRMVRQYADDMASGRWVYNGQNLIFDKDGYLIDGQHRLNAVVKSGATVEMGVTIGVDRATFDTIDTGRRRNNSDLMAMLGSEAHRMASVIVRTAILLDRKDALNSDVSRRDVVDYYTQWEDQVAAAAEYSRKHFLRSVITPGALGTVMFMATRHGVYTVADFEAFVGPFLSGEGLVVGDPRHSLREWAINQRIRKSRVGPTQALWAVIRAWRVWTAGGTISVIRTPQDAFGWNDNYIPGQDLANG